MIFISRETASSPVQGVVVLQQAPVDPLPGLGVLGRDGAGECEGAEEETDQESLDHLQWRTGGLGRDSRVFLYISSLPTAATLTGLTPLRDDYEVDSDAFLNYRTVFPFRFLFYKIN